MVCKSASIIVLIFVALTTTTWCTIASAQNRVIHDPKPQTEAIAIKYTNEDGEQGTQNFALEIAADSASISRGLSGREEIKEHGGMLFIYQGAATRSFWMRNCLVDIDVIFLDATGKVVRTYAMKKEPLRRPGEEMWRYENRLKRHRSVRPAQFVIELRAGWIKKLGIKEGDVIHADWKRIVKHADRD